MHEYGTHQMTDPDHDAFVPDAGQPLHFFPESYPDTYPSNYLSNHPDAYPDTYLDAGPDAYPDAYPDSPSFPDAGPDGYPDFPPDAGPRRWDLDSEFEQLFQPPSQYAAVPIQQETPSGTPRVDRRRKRPRVVRRRWPAVLRIAIAGTTAAVTSVVSVLGARVSYGPLRDLASPTAYSLASSWPLLIYGPWSVACLSILHAAAYRRQVRAAWLAVLLFSAIAMALCIAHAPRTATAIATAGLPPVSALVSFHLLFRQITLLHPRHAKLPRQRRH